MKHLKKLAAFLAAVVMVITMSMPVMAAEKVDVSKHTFNAYTIFTAQSVTTDKSGNKVLGDLAWGTGVNDTAKAALLACAGETAATVDDLAKYLSSATADQIAAFNKVAYAQKANLGTGTSVTSGTTKLPLGYYLIADESDATTVDAVNKAILYPSTDASAAVTVESKVNVPTSQKKVKDTNDSEANSTSGWQDTADWDIGDAVPFQLTATLPDNYSKYDAYHFTFHDKESAGLDAPQNIVVKLGDKTLKETENYTVVSNPTDKDTFDITFSADQLKAAGASDGATITVEYTAVLNSSAKIGQEGNPNTSWITFNNDVNSTGDGENGKTPHDTVIVFTYKTIINKTDGKAPLEGAEFALYKVVADSTKGTKGSDVKTTLTTANDKVDVSGFDDAKYYVEIAKDKTDSTKTSFAFKGIDDGQYVLVETKTPDGFNSIANQVFTVTATHKDGAEVTFENDGLGGKDSTGAYVLSGLTGKVDTGEITLAGDTAEGKLASDVTNKAGSTLPSTGGMGTTILYVLGGLLVAGAVVVLVLKNKKNA